MITDPVSTRLLRGQLQWMAKAGFEVHLACSPGPQLEYFARSEGVTMHHLPLIREPHPVADLRALLATITLMYRVRPLLVNSSTPKAGFIGTLAGWLCRVPVRVYVIRGLRFEGEFGLRRSVLRALDQVTVSLATHVVFNSRSLEQLAVREGLVGPGVGMVSGAGSGNGVDVSRFASLPSREDARSALGLDHSAQVIGFVGRLTRAKGLEDLVATFEQLAVARPALRLLLVGDFEEGDPVAGRVQRRIERDHRIVWMGWVEDPAPVYPVMDVLAFPSYREGLPNVPLEAQAAGVPVVAYSATGTVDAVRSGETGELVAVGDIEALTRVVGELIDDPERGRKLGEQGCAWVTKEFAPERLWQELENCYIEWIR